MSDGLISEGNSVTFKDDDKKKIYTVTNVDRFADSGEERTEYKLKDSDGTYTVTEKGLRPSEILIKVQPKSESQPAGSESQPAGSESHPAGSESQPAGKSNNGRVVVKKGSPEAKAASEVSGGKNRKSRKDKSFKKKKTKKNVPRKKKRPKKTRRN